MFDTNWHIRTYEKLQSSGKQDWWWIMTITHIEVNSEITGNNQYQIENTKTDYKTKKDKLIYYY